MNKAVVALGSNLDPENNIPKARKIISRQHKVVCESRFLRTQAVGSPDQQEFINGAVYLQTNLNFKELKQELKNAESYLGRERTINKFGPRVIDLDIVVWNDHITDNDFYTRDYLKNAVLELLPDLNY